MACYTEFMKEEIEKKAAYTEPDQEISSELDEKQLPEVAREKLAKFLQRFNTVYGSGALRSYRIEKGVSVEGGDQYSFIARIDKHDKGRWMGTFEDALIIDLDPSGKRIIREEKPPQKDVNSPQ